MAEHGMDKAMLAPEPKRDHQQLRDRLKVLTPLADGDRRSHTHSIAIPSSMNYSTVDITRFRHHHHGRSSYVIVFNPVLPNQEEQSVSPDATQKLQDPLSAKALIIRPEIHGHENDHVLRVPTTKIQEMLTEFLVDPHNPKFRPKKLSSKKTLDIKRHKEQEAIQKSQTLTLLRILETALQPQTESPSTS